MEWEDGFAEILAISQKCDKKRLLSLAYVDQSRTKELIKILARLTFSRVISNQNLIGPNRFHRINRVLVAKTNSSYGLLHYHIDSL